MIAVEELNIRTNILLEHLLYCFHFAMQDKNVCKLELMNYFKKVNNQNRFKNNLISAGMLEIVSKNCKLKVNVLTTN
jgi:hypothetical protein